MTPPAEATTPPDQPLAPGARPDRRRVRGRRQDPRPPAQPPRAGPLRRHVERALLVQVVPAAPAPAADRGPARPGRARARTPGSSTPATASPSPSASRATTTPRPSSPTRARPPGVGGILRDIFTMGARPLAVMDPLFFGPPDDARQRWLVEGVVSGHLGLRQLGRCADRRRRAHLRPVLRPATRSSTCSAWAPCPIERLVLGIASGPGNLAVLLGSTTGRDGIGGVSVLASAGFAGEADGGRPTTPSARASRWVTPSRRSGSSRRASSCSTPSSWSGSRTSAAPAWPAPPARRRRAAASGMDVDVSAVPRREEPAWSRGR